MSPSIDKKIVDGTKRADSLHDDQDYVEDASAVSTNPQVTAGDVNNEEVKKAKGASGDNAAKTADTNEDAVVKSVPPTPKKLSPNKKGTAQTIKKPKRKPGWGTEADRKLEQGGSKSSRGRRLPARKGRAKNIEFDDDDDDDEEDSAVEMTIGAGDEAKTKPNAPSKRKKTTAEGAPKTKRARSS